jgi:hypothetical protein
MKSLDKALTAFQKPNKQTHPLSILRLSTITCFAGLLAYLPHKIIDNLELIIDNLCCIVLE